MRKRPTATKEREVIPLRMRRDYSFCFLLISYLDNLETSQYIAKQPQSVVSVRFTPEFQHIVNQYKKHKEDCYKVLEIVGTNYVFENFGINNLYESLVNCGTQLFFTKTFENDKNVYHLTGANFCRQRICPMCQYRRSEKLFVQMFNVVKHLESEYRFIHLVLTIPNCVGGVALINGIDRLYKAFGKFWNYSKIKKAYRGCLRCLEISYNYDENSFHPHLHCLIAVKPSYFTDSRIYLNYDTVRELWTKAAESDIPLQIYLRSCKQGDYEGVAEVCKYCVKPLDFTKSDSDLQNSTIILTLWHTLKGKRFLQKYGIIRETFNNLYGKSDDEYIDDIRNGDHERMFVRWDDINYYYKGE